MKKKSNNKLVWILGILATAGLGTGGFFLLRKKYLASPESGRSDDPDTRAMSIHNAVDGLGTDEKVIFKTISGLQSTADWVELQQKYYNRYGTELMEDLEDDLNGDEFAKLQTIIDNLE